MAELTVARDTAELVADAVAADRALRRRSLESVRESDVLPTVYGCRSIQLGMTFVARVDEQRGFVFGLFKEQDTAVIARIRVHVRVGRALDPVFAPRAASPRWLFRAPPYLSWPGRSSVLELVTPQRAYTVEFPDRPLPRVRFRDGTDGAERIDWMVGNGHVARLAAGVLMAVGEAQEHDGAGDAGAGDEVRVVLRGDADPSGQLGDDELGARALRGLLQRIQQNLMDFTDGAERAPPPDATRTLPRAGTSLDFGTEYRLDELRCRVRVRLDESGSLAASTETDGTQQFDLGIEWRAGESADRLALGVRVPDLLSSGSLHERFADALQREGWDEQFRSVLNDGDDAFSAPSRVLLRRVLRRGLADRRFVFARLTQQDDDLVLFSQGTERQSAWLLFHVKLEVGPFPERRIEKLSEVSLLAARVPPEFAQVFKSDQFDNVRAYLGRLFRTLHSFERVLVPEEASS